ncbi:MAG: DUF2461 domain-containing protein [Bacteroidota bacterium]
MLSQDTLEFFRELRLNNHKQWFDQNRHRYVAVKKDYHHLVSRLLEEMQKYDHHLSHLQVKDCIFRINRDIRFSKDKSPYKTHLGIIITPYGKKMEYAGYYMHLDEEQGSFAGGGLYMPAPDMLKKVRTEIAHFYEDLDEILSSQDFRETYGDLDRSPDIMLTRPPKGFNESGKALEYLKLKSFTATTEIPADMLVYPAAIHKVVEVFRSLKPLNDFLNRALRAGNESYR